MDNEDGDGPAIGMEDAELLAEEYDDEDEYGDENAQLEGEYGDEYDE
jgi:hypothetical protein